MAAGELERQIGELAGKVSALTPILSRMDNRVEEQGQEIARMKQEVTMAREAGERERASMQERLQKGDRAFENTRLVIEGLKRDVSSLKSGEARSGKRWWDLIQLFIASLLGAAITFGATKLFG